MEIIISLVELQISIKQPRSLYLKNINQQVSNHNWDSTNLKKIRPS